MQILTELKEEIRNKTIIIGDFNTPLTSMDGSSSQKINKETLSLKDTLDLSDITDIYRTFHPKATKYIKWKLMNLKEEIESTTIILGDFNTPLTSMNRDHLDRKSMRKLLP